MKIGVMQHQQKGLTFKKCVNNLENQASISEWKISPRDLDSSIFPLRHVAFFNRKLQRSVSSSTQ